MDKNRLVDVEAQLALLHKKLAHFEREEIVTADAAQKFGVREKIAETRAAIAAKEAERAGLTGTPRASVTEPSPSPGGQNVGVNAPTGQVFNIQNLYGNVTAGGAETPPSAPPPAGKLINVPPRNDFFTGREEILSALHEALTQGGRAAIKQAISGLGGIGKTATATEYAHRYADAYGHVLWTGAADAAALTEGFANIARELGLAEHQKSEETVAAVKRWLAENPGWLLILDNADTPEIVKAFLPNPLRGAVLLTSRAQNFRSVGIANAVNVSVMTEGEAVEFFAKSLGVEELEAGEWEAAKGLAEELGYLPLALEQAAAYVSVEGVGFGEYVKKYGELRTAIFGMSEAQAGDYKETVRTTWGMNFEQVEKASRGAADILRMSAYCGSGGIPFEVIGRGGGEISEAVREATKEGGFVSEALTPLTRYSLIERDTVRETFGVHRLVQEVIKDGMTESERREWIERGVKAVNAAFPESGDFVHWPVLSRLAPHGVALGEAAARAGAESAEVARLLNQTGYFLHAQGRYAETAPLFERSLAITEKALGAEHPDTAGSLNNLANLYSAQGEYGRALRLYERSLAIREKALGAEHPSTAESLNNLAGLYEAQGEYGRALPLSERALAITEKALGAEHPLTATSLNNLAGLYESQGEYGRALPLFERSLAIREKALGAEHPDTAESLNNLALLYRAQGEYGRALPLYERSLAIYEKALGAEHPWTAISLNNLAALYKAQGEYGRALPLYERSLAIKEKALGPEHPDTARGLNNLASLYYSQGEYGRAMPLYERSLAIYEKALGAEHPSTAGSLNNLAELYRAQGEYGRALPLYERSLAIREKALGAEHPSTAESLNNLALLYKSQGEYGRALPLYERALAICNLMLGAKHPTTRTIAENLRILRERMAGGE
jgi:tetratricopeptide (TPR) repeat protein